MQENKSEVNYIKVARVIRQLEQCEVWHECYDIEEVPLQDILVAYDIYQHFTPPEAQIIRGELLKMAAQAEIAEAVRWAHSEHDPILLQIPDRPAPSPHILELERNARSEPDPQLRSV